MKVLSLFSGIGAFEKAIKRVGLESELVNYCEIDKYASKSYSKVHNVSEDLNLWDVTTVDTNKLPKDIDLITHGSPCQDFSLAGRQAGGDKDSGTRSSLMYETIRIVEDVKPKIIIWENVKNVLSKKHIHNFENYIKSLDELGYNSHYKLLNAKQYGIPQNRERIFVVSIRKDIDDGNFEFSKGFPLTLRLKDMLDDRVEEKYYLKKTLNIMPKENYLQWDNSGKGYNSQQDRAYYQDGLCPTLSCCNNNGDKSQVVLKDKAEIIRIDIPQIVKVRKYPVDCELLCKCLRDHKFSSNISNKEIAEKLGVPLTKVEHWFRQDDCFAIPDENIWFELKSLLGIQIDEFDDAIMTFEEREGVYEKSNRCYHENGIAPTITSASADEKIIVDDLYSNREPRIYKEYSPSLRAGRQGLKVVEGQSMWTETQEKMITDDGDVKRYIHSDVIDKFEEGQSADISFPNGYNKANRVHDTMPALNNTTTKSSFVYKESQTPLRIRKLTPKECWRLMGFDDEDFEKAAKVNSNAQLYKQAGNSIVVNVLEIIFENLKPYLE